MGFAKLAREHLKSFDGLRDEFVDEPVVFEAD